MILRIFSENKSEKQIAFQLYNPTTNECADIIVVNYGDSDPATNFKKGLIADALHMMASDGRHTNWRVLDILIADIMNKKVHII